MRVSLAALMLVTCAALPAVAFDIGDQRILFEEGKCKKCDLSGADLSGKNLTEEETWTNLQRGSVPGVVIGQANDPLTYSLEVQYTF